MSKEKQPAGEQLKRTRTLKGERSGFKNKADFYNCSEVMRACDRFFDSRGMPRNEYSGQSFGSIGIIKHTDKD